MASIEIDMQSGSQFIITFFPLVQTHVPYHQKKKLMFHVGIVQLKLVVNAAR